MIKIWKFFRKAPVNNGPKRFRISYDSGSDGYRLEEYRNDKYVHVGTYSSEEVAMYKVDKLKKFPKEFD